MIEKTEFGEEGHVIYAIDIRALYKSEEIRDEDFDKLKAKIVDGPYILAIVPKPKPFSLPKWIKKLFGKKV